MRFFICLILISIIACSKKDGTKLKNVFLGIGKSSWYGPGFHGKKTANGEKFDMNSLTAAHKHLEFNTMVRVTNIENKKNVVVRINDRGPATKHRVIDLSKQAAKEIDLIKKGIVDVKLEIVGYKKTNIAALIKHYKNVFKAKQRK